MLIHVAAETLPIADDKLYQASRGLIMICEYDNPVPVTAMYRGNEDGLFKRDRCGEMLDRIADLRLLDHGRVFRRVPSHRQDDVTWFLLEKR